MIVVHVIVGLDVGGAEHMLRRLVLAQRAADPGLSCTVVSLTSHGPVGEMLRDAGVPVVALGMRSQMDAPRAFWRLQQLLRAVRPDLVQTWMVHADLIGGLAARMVGIRAVLWGVRTTDFSNAPLATRVVRWLCARLSGIVPHTIVCAADASRQTHVQAGYDAKRMVVIPNGFDLDALRPVKEARLRLRTELGFDTALVVVGCIGRYCPVKDHANFIAAAGIAAAQRDDLRFLMVGRDIDAKNAELGALIEATGHGQRFALLGEQADVRECLSAMDVFALPSRAEAFPNVVGEAMAMGVPCAVTDVGDAAILVKDTGVVVAREDALALAEAMLALASMTAAARRALGERARMRVATEFSMRRACERFAKLQAAVLTDVQSDRKGS